MERGVFKKAYSLAERLEACEELGYMFDYGGTDTALNKYVSILVRYDNEFKNKLRELITETQKRLQKEFDEL